MSHSAAGLAALLEAEAPPELRIPKRTMARAEGLEQSLRAQISELRHLDQTIALLGWDEETVLPPAGRAERGEQLATLEGIRHAMLVSDRLGDLVEEVAAQSEGNERLSRELVLLRRLRRHALALPQDLVRQFANAKSQSLGAWEEARAKDAYALFAPSFDQLLALVRERAQALAGAGEPYDALLDEHEPGMGRSRLDPVLDEVRNALVPLVREAESILQPDCCADVDLWRRANGNFAGNCSPPWVSLSSAGGSTARPIRSRFWPAPTTCALPSASTRAICPRRCWLRCMRADTGSTIKASIPMIATRYSPKPPAWDCKNPSRASGRTMSAAAARSGTMCFRVCRDYSPTRSGGSMPRLSTGASIWCGRA